MARFCSYGFVTVVVCFACGGAAGAESAPRFVDVAEAAGLDFVQRSGTAEQTAIVEVKSTGAALLDLDGDGLLDIFFTSGSTVERQREGKPGFGGRLFRNRGGLRFEDVTEAWKLPELGWACGAAAADCDGDGRDDLFVTCYGPDRLFLNRGDHLEEAPGSGLGDGWSTSAAFGDLDGDGDLDLYVARYLDFDFENPPVHGQGFSCLWKEHIVACGPRGLPPRADAVYENLGGGEFRDATKDWIVGTVAPQYGLGVVIADLVGDRRPDVFVANDSSPNFLFENRDGKLHEIGFVSGVSYGEDGQEQAGMGIAVGDVDDNGKLDLVVTNFEEERNNLYMNQGNGFFVDRADRWGLGLASHGFLSWGTALRDFDHDGLLDLFVANGHVYPQAALIPDHPGYGQRDHLFLAEREGKRVRFVECGEARGLTDTRVSRGAAFGDLDNDGDVDVVVCHLNDHPALYENRLAGENRWLTLTLAQDGPNRQAIGARVEVTAGSVHRVAEVVRQESFQCSNDPRLHVGLGSDAPAGTARVRWPDGELEGFTIPAGGGTVTLVRGKGGQPEGAGSEDGSSEKDRERG